MLKKRVIPIICMIAVSAVVISLLMLNREESRRSEPSLQEVFDEINAARAAVRQPETPETTFLVLDNPHVFIDGSVVNHSLQYRSKRY